MKKNFLKISFLVLFSLTMSTLTTSCGSDNDNAIETKADPNGYELKGELTGTRTLLAGQKYTLTGGYHVKNGGNLIIQEGVTIESTRAIDGACDYILVEQGGKINAKGTKDKPVVMTSVLKEPKAWGGIHICGKAPINLIGATKSEIGDAPFGGTDANDNSGVLSYVRLEYTGFAFNAEKESNGFTFYGVGRGTQLDHLQSYKGADDGFEWFGGTVDAKYLVSTASEDDSFDWTDGWVGRGQFWIAVQDQSAPDATGTANGDCLIEADTRSDDFARKPASCPTLANLTLIGNNDTNAQKRGIRLRAGTYVKLYNSLVTGKPKCITTATAETEQSFIDGMSEIQYVYTANAYSYESGAALALDTKTGNAVNQTFSFTNGYVGTIDGGKDMSTVDSYFTKALFKGAVNANDDWTAGWTLK